MIEVIDLVKHYTAADGRIVRAVDGVSFAVGPGEMVGLLGANGAGKTTTLRVLATLLRPTSGTARVAGCDVVLDPVGARCQLGYVSATTGVPDRLTHPFSVSVNKNILYPCWCDFKFTASCT